MSLSAATDWALYGICVALILGPEPQDEVGWLWPILLLAFSLWLLASSAVESRKMAYPYLNASTLLMFCFFLHYGCHGVIVQAWQYLPWIDESTRASAEALGVTQNIATTCRIAIVGGIGCFLGTRVPIVVLHNAIDVAKLAPLVERAIPAIVPLLLLQFLALAFVEVRFRQIVNVGSSFGQVLIVLFAFLATSRFYDRSFGGRGKFWWACALGSIVYVLPTTVTGMRDWFLKPPIFILLGAIASTRRIPIKWIALGLATTLIGVLPIIGTAKEIKFQNTIDGLDRFTVAFDEARKEGFLTVWDQQLSKLVFRLNLLSFISVYARHYPSTFDYVNGESFAVEVANIVPRVAWPDKPELSTTLNLYAKGVGIVNAEDDQTSAVFDAFSEYYVNFGLVGVGVLSWFHGLFYRFVERYLARLPSPIGVCGLSVLVIQNHDFFGFVLLFSSIFQQCLLWRALSALMTAQVAKDHLSLRVRRVTQP